MPLPVDFKRLSTVALLLALAGCSQELYGEAQDPVTLQFGDAVASNRAMQMVDPWPAHAANTNLSFKGRPMNSAIDRYYTGTVLPPVAPGANSGLTGASKSASAGGGTATN
jgi:hypothetical protein